MVGFSDPRQSWKRNHIDLSYCNALPLSRWWILFLCSKAITGILDRDWGYLPYVEWDWTVDPHNGNVSANQSNLAVYPIICSPCFGGDDGAHLEETWVAILWAEHLCLTKLQCMGWAAPFSQCHHSWQIPWSIGIQGCCALALWIKCEIDGGKREKKYLVHSPYMPANDWLQTGYSMRKRLVCSRNKQWSYSGWQHIYHQAFLQTNTTSETLSARREGSEASHDPAACEVMRYDDPTATAHVIVS